MANQSPARVGESQQRSRQSVLRETARFQALEKLLSISARWIATRGAPRITAAHSGSTDANIRPTVSAFPPQITAAGIEYGRRDFAVNGERDSEWIARCHEL
jgi:hypothetical protein